MKSKGQQLEIFVADTLKKVFPNDKSIRPTKASSGGVRNTERGDIYNSSGLIIECKNWDKKNISFSLDVWNKLISQTRLGTEEVPLYIIKHPNGEIFTLLTFNDWCKLLRERG